MSIYYMPLYCMPLLKLPLYIFPSWICHSMEWKIKLACFRNAQRENKANTTCLHDNFLIQFWPKSKIWLKFDLILNFIFTCLSVLAKIHLLIKILWFDFEFYSGLFFLVKFWPKSKIWLNFDTHLVDAKVGGALLLHLPLHVHLDQARRSDLVVHHPCRRKKGHFVQRKRAF